MYEVDLNPFLVFKNIAIVKMINQLIETKKFICLL